MSEITQEEREKVERFAADNNATLVRLRLKENPSMTAEQLLKEDFFDTIGTMECAEALLEAARLEMTIMGGSSEGKTPANAENTGKDYGNIPSTEDLPGDDMRAFSTPTIFVR